MLLALFEVFGVSELLAEFACLRWQSAVYAWQFDQFQRAEVLADVAQVLLSESVQSPVHELLPDELSLLAGQHGVLADQPVKSCTDDAHLFAVESHVFLARGI